MHCAVDDVASITNVTLNAGTELLAEAVALYPPLAGLRVDKIRYGVRANPPRSPIGSLPLVGRILSSDRWSLADHARHVIHMIADFGMSPG